MQKRRLRFLEQKSKFPGAVHEKIEEAIDDFLNKIEEAVRGMIFYNPDQDEDQEYEGEEEVLVRRGLDCDIDTEEHKWKL